MARRPRRTRESIRDQHPSTHCRGHGPEWWSRYPADELAAAQQQGRNLREHGYGSVTWEDLLGKQ